MRSKLRSVSISVVRLFVRSIREKKQVSRIKIKDDKKGAWAQRTGLHERELVRKYKASFSPCLLSVRFFLFVFIYNSEALTPVDLLALSLVPIMSMCPSPTRMLWNMEHKNTSSGGRAAIHSPITIHLILAHAAQLTVRCWVHFTMSLSLSLSVSLCVRTCHPVSPCPTAQKHH